MAEALTLLAVVAVTAALGLRLWLANRRAAKQAEEARRAAAERREKERALLERLDEVQKKTDAQRAAAAIARDPERAAGVVKNMLRDKR